MDPDDLNSYRLISNLSFAPKLVERSVAARFVKHSDQNHLFPDLSSAFRWHHSIETAVLVVYNAIIRAIDNGQSTIMLFLDFSSAFDTVHHDIMLHLTSSFLCSIGLTRTRPIALRRSPSVMVIPILIASAAVFHKDQFSGLWNSWPTLRAS